MKDFVTDFTLPLAIIGAAFAAGVPVAAIFFLFKWMKGKGPKVNGPQIKEAVAVYKDTKIGASKSSFINNSNRIYVRKCYLQTVSENHDIKPII